MKSAIWLVPLLFVFPCLLHASIFDISKSLKKQIDAVQQKQKEAEKEEAALKKEVEKLKVQLAQEQANKKQAIAAKEAELGEKQRLLDENNRRQSDLLQKEISLDNKETRIEILQYTVGGGGIALVIGLCVAIRNFRTAALTDKKLALESELVLLTIAEKRKALGIEPNKAPEPTPGSVTPRATEGVSK